MRSTLYFHGGAGEVTGACFLLDAGDVRLLLDCGLTQGSHFAKEQNYAPFPFEPASVDVLLVSHAHMDHIGRIPRLFKEGFSGVVYSTPATKDLAAVMYQDALKLLQQEAQELGHEPLYGPADVEQALANWKTYPYHEPFSIGSVQASFLDAGHILGSAMVQLVRDNKKFVYTGDLGNSPAPLLPDTETITDADYLLMESVYGDRNHEDKEERVDKLRQAVRDIVDRNGTLVIPAFALQRTQILIYYLNNFVERKEIAPIPVFLDSPLALAVTDVFRQYTHLFNEHVQKQIAAGDDIFAFPGFVQVFDARASQGIVHEPNPKIVLAGSGMSVGGRVLFHEKRFLGDSRNMLLFVGYQGVGTLGRRLQDGARRVRINHEWVTVKAERRSIRGFSAHKDRDHLVAFVADTAEKNKKTWVVMGEPKSSLFLVQRLRDYLGVNAEAPEEGYYEEFAF